MEDDHHLSRSGATRSHFDDTLNTLPGGLVSTFQSNFDAVIASWKTEYEKKVLEKWALEIKHKELQSRHEELNEKADDLQQKNEELQEAYGKLQLQFDNQSSNISKFHESQVSRWNEALVTMEGEAKQRVKMILDMEKEREVDKLRIAELEQEDAFKALENEKKVLREKVEQHIKVLRETHQNENTLLRKNIDRMNAKEKDRDQMIDGMKKQHEVDKTKLAEMEKNVETDRKAHEREKKALLSKIAEMEQSNASPSDVHPNTVIMNSSIVHSDATSSSVNPSAIAKASNDNDHFVIKKLFHVRGGLEWKAYLTSNEKERSKKVCINGSNLLIDDKVVSKKLIIDGLLYQSQVDPFQCFTHNYGGVYLTYVSRLLGGYVHSCNLTYLFLSNQQISWVEYVKLVSATKTKSLYFSNVCIKKEDDSLASFEEIMGNLTNIRKIACAFHPTGSIKLTEDTFAKLLELPLFKNLQIFRLYGITASDPFDVGSFIDFMKKYPNCHFTISFRYDKRYVLTEKKLFDPIVEELRKAFPSDDNLVIDL